MIFTIAEYSVWEIFPWKNVVFLYGIAILIFFLPKPRLVWPLTKFAIFRIAAQRPGVTALLLASLLIASHLIVTIVPLLSQQRSLEIGKFVNMSLIYDGPISRERSTFPSAPELTLSFEGTNYEVPGSLYGLSLLPTIRSKLTAGQSYLISVKDSVILEINHSD